MSRDERVVDRDRSVTRRRRGWVGGAVAAAGLVAVVSVIVAGSPERTEPPGAAAPKTSITGRPPTATLTARPPGVVTQNPSASCALVVEVDGWTYFGYRPTERTPPLTGRTIQGVVPACNDTGGSDGEDEAVDVEEIEGVSTDVAVWFAGSLVVRSGAELPASADAWFEPLTCASDGPTDLIGRWLGVTSQQEVRFNGDVRAPLRIEFIIEEIMPASDGYVGYTIRIHDEGGADPALDKEAVQEALWSSRARLRVQVHCDGTRFVADAFGLVPK